MKRARLSGWMHDFYFLFFSFCMLSQHDHIYNVMNNGTTIMNCVGDTVRAVQLNFTLKSEIGGHTNEFDKRKIKNKNNKNITI